MSKNTIGIVEDEVIIADGLRLLLEELGYDVPEPCSDFEEAIEMLKHEKPDLVLLDIHLANGGSGIEVGKYIREHLNIPFIFLTANSDADTVKLAKHVHPDAYLVKPFQKENLYTAIEIALHNFKLRRGTEATPPAHLINASESLFVKDGHYLHKLRLNEILYISSDHVYVSIVTVDKKYLVRASLQQYAEKLDPKRFIRVHRSHLVNFDKVEKINNTYVIVAGHEVPMSKNYRDNLMNLLSLG